MDLSLVEIVTTIKNNYQEQHVLKRQDLEFQEQRKKRKVKRLDFEIR
jgi:hypothetical protein